MRTGRIVMLVLGTLLALLGLGFVAAAAGAGWLHFQQRDEGFFTSSTERFETSSNAITSLGLDVMVGQRMPDFLPSDTAGSILVRGETERSPGRARLRVGLTKLAGEWTTLHAHHSAPYGRES